MGFFNRLLSRGRAHGRLRVPLKSPKNTKPSPSSFIYVKVALIGTLWPDGVSKLATSEVKGHCPFHLELNGARLLAVGRWPTPVSR